MEFRDFFHRSKNLLLKPDKEWQVIAGDPTPQRVLLFGYAGPVIVVAAIAEFIGTLQPDTAFSFVGGFFASAATLVVLYLSTYIIALITNKLALMFQAKENFPAALNLVVYSLIPFYAAIIIVNMIPDLFFIGPAGFYGLYLFWKGAPVLMGISQEKSIGYTLLTGLIFTVMYVILLQSLSLLVTTVLQVI